MIQRIWSAVSSLFGARRQQPIPIVTRNKKKERFMIIQDPYITQKPDSKQTVTTNQTITKQKQLPTPKNSQQLQSIYILTQGLPFPPSQPQSQPSPQCPQQTALNNQFFLDLTSLTKVLNQIQQRQQQILMGTNQLIEDITTIVTKIVQVKQCQKQQRLMYKNYVNNVQKVLQRKYTGEKKDYVQIQYEQYRHIVAVWNLAGRNSQVGVPGYDHLKYSHLKLLGPQEWLNDQIVSQYTGLMNAKLAQRQNNNYIIFNSLKVTTIFDKSDFTKLSKILTRQKVTPTSTLILCIHKINHWLFLKMQSDSICIYDSLQSSTLNTYINFPLINKIIKFAQFYYGTLPQIQRVVDFPQQSNGYDCGVMMLCGIRDVVRDVYKWTFSQADLKYKRVLITKQLLDKKITGFDIL